MRTLTLVALISSTSLLLFACGDSEEADASDSSGGDSAADAVSCGSCPSPRLCCPSRFEGDIPRCIDPTLNPENCGACGTFCSGACLDSACIDAPSCDAPGDCPEPLACGEGGPQARCCPAGTTFIASPADFFGCCPDGDICGCREGMCPISRRAAKHEITYATQADLEQLAAELLATRLATYRYKGATSPRRELGFIIDDGVPEHGIADDGEHVDLYGYTSLAVATLKVQRLEIMSLRQDLEDLREEVARLRGAEVERQRHDPRETEKPPHR